MLSISHTQSNAISTSAFVSFTNEIICPMMSSQDACISGEWGKIKVFLFMMVYLHRFERITTGCVTPRRLSHAVEHLRDRLLVLFVGSEAITEPSGNLTNGTVDGIASLLDHLQAVRVLCFVHAVSMAQIPGFCSSPRYKTTKENLKVGCANLATGRAAAEFVMLTVSALSINNPCCRWYNLLR